MDAQKQQILEKLNAANNILVTVSRNPSVDQLAACIGLTLLLNKLDKHATAVFSGEVPSTIEFLKPDETIEKNTDSLRDFIIALDKSKADKLRYKVEDTVVKIFITPYRTSIDADDLNFSQGDFNVDVVLAIGVHQQADLDEAITAHGRILHDAVVMCINNTPNGELGSVNWLGTGASSLSELSADLAQSFEGKLLDEQISTALLTGIVAETDRFRNDKTTATTMSISAELMKAGANQQLVAAKLDHEVAQQKPAETPANDDDHATDDNDDKAEPPKPKDGTLEITHQEAKESEHSDYHENTPDDNDGKSADNKDENNDPKPEHNNESQSDKPSQPDANNEPAAQAPVPAPVPQTDDQSDPDNATGNSGEHSESSDTAPTPLARPELTSQWNSVTNLAKPAVPKDNSRPFITEKPALGGQLTANTIADDTRLESSGDPFSQDVGHPPLLGRDEPAATLPPVAPSTNTSWQQSPRASEPTPEISPSKATDFSVTPQPTLPTPTPFAAPPKAASSALPPFRPPQPSFTPPPALTEREDESEPDNSSLNSSTSKSDSLEDIEEARHAVLQAINQQPGGNLPPIAALNAQPLDLGKPAETPPAQSPQPFSFGPQPPAPAQQEPAPMSYSPADRPLDMPLPPAINLPPAQTQPPTNSPVVSSNSPPPVPPPMVPPSYP